LDFFGRQNYYYTTANSTAINSLKLRYCLKYSLDISFGKPLAG
jgi:hypothetical protein